MVHGQLAEQAHLRKANKIPELEIRYLGKRNMTFRAVAVLAEAAVADKWAGGGFGAGNSAARSG